MEYRWSLESLYKDYGEVYQKDVETLKNKLTAIDQLSKNLKSMEDLEDYLQLEIESSKLARSLVAFANLQISVNAKDKISQEVYGQLAQTLSNSAQASARFHKFLIKNKDNFKNWVETSSLIKEHEFILQEIINQAEYLLDEEVESVIAKMKLNASDNWSQLQAFLTSDAKIEFRGEEHTMSSIRNFAYHQDKNIRKEAYFKELELYKKIEDAVAFSLNSIKGEVNVINELRGYEDSVQASLVQSRMERETLEALMEAMEESFPIFRKYFQHKAKLLGHESGLPWYDLFAPLGDENSSEYSIKEAQKIIHDSFASFSDDLAHLSDRAFNEQWIDFYPREGKRDGAFCSNQPQIKESRIMTNYGGSISDVITLAHELGHAYHGYLLEDLSILNTGYTMPVAETASTFCENLVFNHAMKSASKDEQIMLLENSISDLAQIVVDISSRFKFEKTVLETREKKFMFSEDLKEIMLSAQKDTYGDGLDENYLHPYMWICKPHYYSAGLSYYNFPYAFGGLFALGLYAKYEQEGQSFVSKYQELLKATSTAQSEDVAKIAGIDLRDKSFWKESLKLVEERINQFIELTS